MRTFITGLETEWSPDAVASAIYDHCDFDTRRPASAAVLALTYLGPGALRFADFGLGVDAVTCMRTRTTRIRRSLSDRQLNFTIAHEVSEVWRADRGGSHCGNSNDLAEAVCNAIAGALIVPADAFRIALKTVGRDLPRLAEMFCCSEAVIALRLGEVTGAPVALVSPSSIRLRGDSSVWPDPARIREMLRTPPGWLQVRRLSDEAGRIALIAHS